MLRSWAPRRSSLTDRFSLEIETVVAAVADASGDSSASSMMALRRLKESFMRKKGEWSGQRERGPKRD